MSGKNIAWIVGACGIAAVGAAVALLATGFFNAAQPVGAPPMFKMAEARDVDNAPPTAVPPTPAWRDRGPPPPEIALAERLLDDIPNGAKMALQPLDPRYAELEPAVDPLYERPLLALTNAAEDGVPLLASGSDVPSYRLRGELRRWDDQRFRDDARLLLGERKLIADGADMAIVRTGGMAASLSRSNGASEATTRYEAVAKAAVSDRLDAAAARRAARNLARAGVITQALGLHAPLVDEVRSEADVVAALWEYLGKGLPVDEQLHDFGVDDSSRIGVRLVAKVVPVGVARSRPAVTAKLPKTVFRTMEPISIELRREAKVSLGVFAWRGEQSRAAVPDRRSAPIDDGCGRSIGPPVLGEGRNQSEPLRAEGNFEGHGALIVVVGTKNAGYMGLAPVAGATLTETMEQAPGKTRVATLS